MALKRVAFQILVDVPGSVTLDHMQHIADSMAEVIKENTGREVAPIAADWFEAPGAETTPGYKTVNRVTDSPVGTVSVDAAKLNKMFRLLFSGIPSGYLRDDKNHQTHQGDISADLYDLAKQAGYAYPGS